MITDRSLWKELLNLTIKAIDSSLLSIIRVEDVAWWQEPENLNRSSKEWIM